MSRSIVVRWGTAALLGGACWLAPTAQAAEASVQVLVKVRIESTSGICGVQTGAGAIGVACFLPTLVPWNSAETAPSLRYSGSVPQLLGTTESVDLYGGRVQITGRRMVSFDNASYVELTIAW
jgi:hypothetical protein